MKQAPEKPAPVKRSPLVNVNYESGQRIQLRADKNVTEQMYRVG